MRLKSPCRAHTPPSLQSSRTPSHPSSTQDFIPWFPSRGQVRSLHFPSRNSWTSLRTLFRKRRWIPFFLDSSNNCLQFIALDPLTKLNASSSAQHSASQFPQSRTPTTSLTPSPVTDMPRVSVIAVEVQLEVQLDVSFFPVKNEVFKDKVYSASGPVILHFSSLHKSTCLFTSAMPARTTTRAAPSPRPTSTTSCAACTTTNASARGRWEVNPGFFPCGPHPHPHPRPNPRPNPHPRPRALAFIARADSRRRASA